MSVERSPDGQTATRTGLPDGWYTLRVPLSACVREPETNLFKWLTEQELEQIVQLVRVSGSKAEVIARLEEQIRRLKTR